ncbi:MAG: hypothetical protein EPO25_10270 [Gammaproteobacteria bacterium]|nr:MAG: hypothetical protein EPO25_10270 [Gammaproteobacteria bacterium]
MTVRNLASNALWALLSHILSRGSLMVSAIVLARSLDSLSFAAYSYFQITISMLAAYASMGLGVTASRFFAEVGIDIAGREPPPLSTLCCLAVVLAGFAFLVVLGLPSAWLNAGLPVPRWMLALGMFLLALGVMLNGAILGLEKFRQASLVSAVSGTTMLLGTWLAAKHHSAPIGMASLLLAVLVQNIGEAMIVFHAIGWRRFVRDLKVRRSDVERVFGFAGPMLIVSLVSASGAWLLGRLVLQGKGGSHAFALYAIGLQWFSLVLLLPGMLSRVILPRLVRRSAGGSDTNAVRALVRRGAWMAMVAATAMTVVGLLLGPWLLSIYGAHYAAGRWFIGAFMAAAILSAPANTIGNAIVVHDGQRQWLLLTLVWLVVLLAAGSSFSSAGAWSGAIAQAVAALVLSTLALAVARSRRLV